MYEQIGVSQIRLGDNLRFLQRGGGAENFEYLRTALAAENCTEICYLGMQFGGLGNSWSSLPSPGQFDPHYLKCMEGPAVTPPNGKRIQLASQQDTNDIAPLLPQMNISDWFACLGIFIRL